MSPVSKSQQKAVATYMKNNYDEIKVRVSKGSKEVIQEIATSRRESINGYIKSAIKAKIKADTERDIEI
ncbi:MAG: hypothetical protein RR253_03275 [Oscillospiraceae bacterium]